MKHSLKNDKGLMSTKTVDGYQAKMPTGPSSAPSEKLLAGKPVKFKNAEKEGTPLLVDYDF